MLMFTKQDIESYFTAFKNEQLLLMIPGGAALIVALLFYFWLKTPWHKGFALPLAVFAMLFCGAGFSNYKKTEQLRIRSVYNYDMHPEQLKIKELPRAKEVQQNMRVLIYLNASIIIASFLIFLYFRKKEENEYYMGTASSLFLMSSLSVAIYFFMLGPLKAYTAGIEKFTEKIIVKPSPASPEERAVPIQ